MIGAWKARIQELKNLINSKNTEIQTHHEKIKKSLASGLEQCNTISRKIGEYYNHSLSNNTKFTQTELAQFSPYHRPDWHKDNWAAWDFQSNTIERKLCVGKFVENGEGALDESFIVPAFLPFVGTNKTLVLESRGDDLSSVNKIMESLILRLSLMYPHQTRFSFLDPSGFGKAFPISGQVNTRDNLEEAYRVLEEILSDMRRIITTYGLADTNTFFDIADNILINEQIEFIFAANFPKGYDRRTIEKLQSLSNNGTVAGKYLVIHHNQDVELPRDVSMAGFEAVQKLPVEEQAYDFDSLGLRFIPDYAPEPGFSRALLQKLRDSKPPEKTIEWGEEVNIDEPSWWSHSAAEFIETTIGRSGSADRLNIWFGAKKSEGNRPCSHGMLGAMTGSGKSNLYHVLIMGLAVRYSPEELQLYLIDGKDGVEFQPYKDLPHTAVLSLKSQPQLSRSILTDLIDEKERRNNLFSQHQVNSFEEYRKLSSANKLPRILLLVDEYQELFDADRDGNASNTLLALAQQGRSAGIHMFLGSQKFGAVGMLHQQAIFGNIHLRVGMKMTLADRNALTEFGREGKQFIATCNQPGKVVLNDQSGDDGGNKLGKVAFLQSQVRNEVITQLREKSAGLDNSDILLSANVFNGNEQPRLLDNPQIGYLLSKSDKWLDKQQLEAFAKRDIFSGGLGNNKWFSGLRPLVFWIGQEFNVRGYAHITMQRSRSENLLLVGDRNDARYGMLCSLLLSQAITYPPDSTVFYVVDKSIRGTEWSSALESVVEQVFKPLSISSHFTTSNKQFETYIAEIITELERRKELEEEQVLAQPNIFLLLTEADRINALAQIDSKYGTKEDSDLGKRLKQIYTEGSSLGIYTTLSFEGVMPMKNTIGTKSFDYFRHRVALQMSEDDAFTFVRKRHPSRLQAQGAKPISAYYIDMNSNTDAIFKPYVIGEELEQEILDIINKLKKRL